MHKIAKNIIEKRINKLIEEWNFENRKENNINECVCYSENKKCHNLENLNCLFCYCPHYDTSIKEGKCRINSPDGKYIDNHEGKILDCSDCDFPHKMENVREILIKRCYNL
jgi:Zn-finger protein